MSRELIFLYSIIYSYDGGETFGHTESTNILEPILGCEGSVQYSKKNDKIYYVGPVSKGILWRKDMWIFESSNKGKTWNKLVQVREKASGYSAQANLNGRLVLHYETSEDDKLIMKPDRLVFKELGVEI